MSLATRKLLQLGLAALTGVGVLFVDDPLVGIPTGSIVSQAEARVGRPATPMSYAGVARRTTRRAYGAAAVGASAYPSGGYAASCYQAVDAYGRVYTQCP
jgi:hypothetical protein